MISLKQESEAKSVVILEENPSALQQFGVRRWNPFNLIRISVLGISVSEQQRVVPDRYTFNNLPFLKSDIDVLSGYETLSEVAPFKV